MQQLYEIMSALSKVDGIYTAWAKKYKQNYYTSHIFYIIYMSRYLIKQTEIVSISGMPKQTVNSVISQLLKKKYITLRIDPADKRSKIIELTPEGSCYAQSIFEPLLSCEQNSLKKIGEKRLQEMVGTLTEYAKYLEQELKQL